MSSAQEYPNTMPGMIDAGQLCGDVAPGMVSDEWYAPGSVRSTTSSMAAINDQRSTIYQSRRRHPSDQDHSLTLAQYAFNDQYMTPYPSSSVESQPWTQYARASIPNTNLFPYAFDPSMQQPQPTPSGPGRPRSSPSTFGPSPDSIPWSTPNPLGIQYSTAAGHPTPPVTSTFAPAVFQNYPPDHHEAFTTPSPPELQQPRPRRNYTPIAPHPLNITAPPPSQPPLQASTPPGQKRQHSELETPADDSSSSAAGRPKRPRTRTLSHPLDAAALSDDDRFLVQLKEDEQLPWKDIATRFSSARGKPFQVAALQMRYKRLREKFRPWELQDVEALRSAHEYWEKYKWEIIATKMLDFGPTERWPARHCARKWSELEAQALAATSAGLTPGLSQFSSPVEAPLRFAFMPLQ